VPLQAETLVDIGHESLIRQWRRLAGWVDDESRSAAIYQRLAGTAQLWQAGDAGLWGNPDLARATQWRERQKPTVAWALRYGSEADFDQAMRFLEASEVEWQRTSERTRREEQDRITREARDATRKRFTWWVSALAGLALLAAGVALRQWYVADEEATAATAAREQAEKDATAARSALEGVQQLVKSQLLASTNPGEAAALRDQAQTQLAYAQRIVDPTPSAQVAPAAPSARVYMQIQDEQQRVPARRIAEDLRKESFAVPGIERLQTGPTKFTEVRFFRRNEQPQAEKIVGLLQKAGVADVVSKYVPGFEDSKRIRAQHFEVWFASSAFQGPPRSSVATSQPPPG
jgi:hypothetical protein